MAIVRGGVAKGGGSGVVGGWRDGVERERAGAELVKQNIGAIRASEVAAREVRRRSRGATELSQKSSKARSSFILCSQPCSSFTAFLATVSPLSLARPAYEAVRLALKRFSEYLLPTSGRCLCTQ